jgi:hypothetical protein
MEEFKIALKAQCNDHYAVCAEDSCEVRVWKLNYPNKTHACHGKAYVELAMHYDTIHKKQIEDMENEVKDAHNAYAASTASHTPSGKGSNSSPKIQVPVQTLFDSYVYPTYQNEQKPFEDASAEIGSLDNDECIEKYNAKYLDCDNHPTVVSIDKSDTTAIAKRTRDLHTAMNKSIRDQDHDSDGMVAALKSIFSD